MSYIPSPPFFFFSSVVLEIQFRVLWMLGKHSTTEFYLQLSSPFLKKLFIYLWQRSPYVAQTDLELMILLPQLPQCWDYSHEQPHLASLPIFKLCYLSFISFSFENSLYILYTRPLSNIWIINIFFILWIVFLTVLVASFEAQRFYFYLFIFWGQSWELNSGPQAC
jgi:hypothetical protein